MPAPEDVIRLRHMLDAAEKVIEFTQACQRIDLDQDEKLALAVVRLIEIIGEAARHVTETTQNQFPEVPWRQIVGTRDRLIHGYFDVDLDIVWSIITTDLPPLIDLLHKIVPKE
jgi:uncharacterized protein with HEPN domain